MKVIFYSSIVIALNTMLAWLTWSHYSSTNFYVITMVALLFIVPNLGTIWMLYTAVRFEKKPLFFILLAFVPYAFAWYYFERVKPGRHKS